MTSALKSFLFAAAVAAAMGLPGACLAQTAESPFGDSMAGGTSGETFRVMTWNLEHFVDPYNDPYIDSPNEDNAQTKSEPALRRIVDTVRAENPAVVVFTEVESDRSINLMFNSFWPGHPYKYYAAAESLQWYQNVVIVSRYPISTFTSFREAQLTNPVTGEVESKYNSRLIVADIKAPTGYEFTVAGLHLKAGPGGEDVAWRKQQIKLLSEWFAREQRLNPGRNLLALGDMNFAVGTEEYHMFLDGTPVKFEDAFGRAPTPYTHPSRSPGRRIDHIFAGHAMMREFVPGSARVLTGEGMDLLSDHLAVVADFYAGDR